MHEREERVSFNLPVEVGELLERRVVSWWQQAGEDWPSNRWRTHPEFDGLHDISDLAKELTVWLQVWYPTDGKPHVFQPSLRLESIIWEKYDGSIMDLGFHMSFVCDERNPCEEAGENDGGLLILGFNMRRESFSTDGMNGALEVTLRLQCESLSTDVQNESFLTSGYLSKLKSVC